MVKPAREIVELVSDAVGCGMLSKMLSCLSFPADADGVKWLPWSSPLLGQLLDHRDFARRAPNYGKSVDGLLMRGGSDSKHHCVATSDRSTNARGRVQGTGSVDHLQWSLHQRIGRA